MSIQQLLAKFTLADMQDERLAEAFRFWWNEASDLLSLKIIKGRYYDYDTRFKNIISEIKSVREEMQYQALSDDDKEKYDRMVENEEYQVWQEGRIY